ncbi:phosphate ABC transporter substrate-binding protein, PhoT family [Ectothiorhodosinus mongolicus]|uniref:Phosphate-binding protein n=1 Tax=Ectothiorhodosinus mongolicus TaxID=233100 RepID=A0A1R3VWA7_9GAMM|nr:phosphate ABC transporter substrate-binding protein PstS family protein [Ectothiorhodosinus mongolicus]ULX56968.1 phosphate-binding protein [Ectothiorhodosinus mongolicus]SIT69223.1 phosphate ABC transporter substrate-binding protein, PhoT family [Ectothiorhodosinus mongolicus]
MNNLRRTTLGLAMAFTMAAPVAMADVDPNLPDYQRVSGISGNLSSVGSDTLNNLMTLWAEEFASFYPNVNIQIQGAGTSTAPPALIEGTSNFGPMSRPMRDSEQRGFEDRYGYAPTLVPVAIDMIAVFVNKDNPIADLSMPQVDAIFSATRACGHSSDIRTWGDAGMTGSWANRDITIYGRNAVSGTYGFFREVALCGGDFKDTVNEQPGSSAVVRGVEQTLGGVGYSGIGYSTSGVRVVPLNGFEASGANAATGDYPLARFLYVAANQHPTNGWNPLEKEFFRLVLSKEGQGVVHRDGYVTLDAAAAERFRREFNLN